MVIIIYHAQRFRDAICRHRQSCLVGEGVGSYCACAVSTCVIACARGEFL